MPHPTRDPRRPGIRPPRFRAPGCRPRGARTAARLFASLLAVSAPFGAAASTVTRPVEWSIDGTHFRGVLVWDDASRATRPGLLMVPNWHGVNDAAVAKAVRIAGRDDVILVADLYGTAIRPRNDDEARRAVAPLFANRALLRRRVNVAFGELAAASGVAPIDRSRLAAIGFCFGGAAVLDLARSGADVKAVVSFHGELSTDDPARAANIRARVLAMNGADDPLTAPQFGAFLDEMRRDPAPWRFTAIGHAVHCFTERDATAQTGACRYDASAAAQSYALMRDWLRDSFAGGPDGRDGG